MPNSHYIDLAVVAAYLVTITVVGIWIGRKHSKSQEGYFLGNRQFGWVMVGFSLFATNISMAFFVGGTGKAYKVGIAALTPELLGGLGMTVSALLFIPIYLRSSITTLPQFLGKRFNKWAKVFYGGVFIVFTILTSPLTMYTGSLAILSLFQFEITPANIYLASAVIACTVGLYSVLGGLTAVVITDAAQVVIMIFGGLLVAIMGIFALGGFSEFWSAIPASKLELLLPHDDPEFPWSAMMTGQLMASFFFAFANITMLQRVLGARSLEHAQKGMLLGAGLKMSGLVLFILPGLIAAQLFPEIHPDTAFTTLTRELLPVGLSGLVLAGMIAAMMSTQDSGINTLASIVSIDIYPTFSKKADPQKGILIGKSIAVCNIIWGVAMAPIFLTVQQGIFDLMLKFGGFIMMPTGLCFVLGRFWSRGTSKACLATLSTGLLLGVYYNLSSSLPAFSSLLPEALGQMHYYHVLPLFAALLALIFIVISLLDQAPTKEQLEFLKENTPERPASPKPWHRSFGFWWTLYLVAFIALYLYF
ncbi:SLC5 family protein [Pelagicoccus mobilis]|uniref:Sodium/solute symporter n=1 Tax=Pelagicoccus mobilis TaxID=415221 RepID=A0A934S3Y2_9BACT|nr:sodium/solute symporter [Pelagicoccus mobilis]MBK1878598.1 sodium/solute symporter [Pelagicoccus mobilis]